MKTNKIIMISFISLSILIVVLEGVLPNFFTLWNLIPIRLFYFLLKTGLKHRSKILIKIALTLNGIFLVGFPIFVHIYRFFDIEKFQTGSSTSALVFIFTPIWALVFSLIPSSIQGIYQLTLKYRTKTGLK